MIIKKEDDAMVLTEGDLNEIGDKIRVTTMKLWKQFE